MDTRLQPLSIPDRARFLIHGFGPTKFPDHQLIHEAFRAFASRFPDQVAVKHLFEELTYGQLDTQSDELAAYLTSRGVEVGSRVALVVQRSLPMIVAIVAILKSGASYIPMDGGIVTASTFQFILDDAKVTFVLYLAAFAHKVGSRVPGACLSDDFRCHPAGYSTSRVVSKHTQSESAEAYVIYTSGTTGRPKGVSVTHGNITNLLCLNEGRVGMRPGMRVAQLLNVAFDMCAWEVLGSLMNGCTLHMRGPARSDWSKTLRSVDIVISTPTILQCYDPVDFPNILHVATAGEPCPQALADKWARSCTFYNGCGPTETTIVNTIHKHILGGAISIGKPTPNNNVYILDEDQLPVPFGTVGEMWAGGRGVSRGYVNRHSLTAERYRRDPFVGDGPLMFATGDLARWTDAGRLEHCGRKDDQVKIKGFRCELDGVSAAIECHSSVSQAVTVVLNNSLYAFFTLKPSGRSAVDTEEETINGVCKTTRLLLPYYSIPSSFTILDRLPLTTNGKTDKAHLRTLALAGHISSAATKALKNIYPITSPILDGITHSLSERRDVFGLI